MEGPRPPESHELSKIVQFLDRNLRPGSHWSIAKEYPTALTPSNLHNMRIITDKEDVVSHAVIKPLIVKTPLLIYKIAAIGSVVTDSLYRNQGLSRSILDHCLVESRKQNCDIAILWTNIYDFYRRMNFELAGFEHSFTINPSLTQFKEELDPGSWKKMRFLCGNQISVEDFLKVYSRHTVMTIRSTEEIKKFLQIPESRIYTVWSDSGPLQAYAVEGKGADLQNYIHEWGGNMPAILFLLNSIINQKKNEEKFTIIVPQHSVNLLSYLLRKNEIEHKDGFLGMIKIIHPESLFYKVHKAAQSLGIKNLVLEQNSAGKYKWGIGDDFIEIEDEKVLVRCIFGPLPEDIELKDKKNSETLLRIFPLPLWLWGWDSI